MENHHWKVDPTLVEFTPSSHELSKISIPYEIGPYRIKGLLKEGGTSFLYLGVKPKSQELLAIKVLKSKYLAQSDMVRHFMKEAQIIEMADHPNIVRLDGHGSWKKGVFIAMEFVQGISLRKLILQRALSFKKALEIVLEISKALSHLHAHQVIHRDLKPDNILLSETGAIKVIDFGISQVVHEPKALTHKRKVMGTLSYMSPEQKMKDQEATFASDQYALAIIAYELCLSKLCYGVLQLSQLPKGLRNILAKALNQKPSDRYPSIDEFHEALFNYLHHDFSENEELLDLSFKELSQINQSESFSLFNARKLSTQDYQLEAYCPKKARCAHHVFSHVSSHEEYDGYVLAAPSYSGAKGIFEGIYLKGLFEGAMKVGDSKVDPLEILHRTQTLFESDASLNLNFVEFIYSKKTKAWSFFVKGHCEIFVKDNSKGIEHYQENVSEEFYTFDHFDSLIIKLADKKTKLSKEEIETLFEKKQSQSWDHFLEKNTSNINSLKSFASSWIHIKKNL